MGRFASIISFFVLVLASMQAAAEMPRIELTAGFYRIEAEVAADQTWRRRPRTTIVQPPPRALPWK